MDAELWAEIRRLHFREGWKKKAIARHLRVDPKTVRHALRVERYEPRRAPRRTSLLDPWRDTPNRI